LNETLTMLLPADAEIGGSGHRRIWLQYRTGGISLSLHGSFFAPSSDAARGFRLLGIYQPIPKNY
jgi:hypothetical protein